MSTWRMSCNRCGNPSLVPLDPQSLMCPACGCYMRLQNNPPPPSRPQTQHFYTNTPSTAYGRLYRPPNTRFQPQPQPQPRPSNAYGRKRALLCGITYKGHHSSLEGSVNDVLLMKRLLVETLGFPNASILMLTEEQDYSHYPTKKNIRAAMRWLVQGCQPGDSLVFHYSGHGSQVRDRDGDEIDGFDESLLPVDYETEGRILDDEINEIIVRPLTKGVTLHAIIDTCFSGTFLDLTNVCRITKDGFYRWEDHRAPHAFKGTSGGQAISISACDDHQSSGDTTAFTGTATGALTYNFVHTVRRQPRLTYGNLLISMHKQIAATQEALHLDSDEHTPQVCLSKTVEELLLFGLPFSPFETGFLRR